MSLYERLHGKKPYEETKKENTPEPPILHTDIIVDYPPLVRDKLLTAFYQEPVADLENLKEKNKSEEIVIVKQKLLEILASKISYPLSKNQKDTIVQDVTDEISGLGILERLIREDVEGIFIKSYDTIYKQKNGKWETANIKFILEEHLYHNLEKIFSAIDKAVVEGGFGGILGIGSMKFIPTTVCCSLNSFVAKGLIGKSTAVFLLSQDLTPPEDYLDDINIDDTTTFNLGMYLLLRDK